MTSMTTHTQDQALVDLEARWHEIDRELERVTAERLQRGALDESELGQRAQAAFDERCEVEREIAIVPAQGLTGLAVKLRRYLCWIEADLRDRNETDDDLDIDDRLAVSAARDAARLTTEGAAHEHLPPESGKSSACRGRT